MGIGELSGLLKLDLHKKIDDLSFGNKKKVGIVQGLLHDLQLIILDEPTGGLDPLMQKKLLRADQGRKQGRQDRLFFIAYFERSPEDM